MSRQTNVKLVAELLPSKQRLAVKDAADKLFEDMLSNKQAPSGVYLVNEIWPNLKQADKAVDPTLVLAPMDRVGGEPGKSGNAVLAGRFFLTHDELPSNPMIIKISPDPEADASLANEKRDKLVIEWKAAEFLAPQFSNRCRFACPLYLFDERGKPAVLWAPFESEWDYPLPLPEEPEVRVKVEEMAKYLSPIPPALHENQHEREQQLNKILDAVDFLKEAHLVKGINHRDSINLVDHYADYLRDVHNLDSLWAQPWRRLWGNATPVSDFGESGWPNPFLVCEALRKLGPHSLRTGFVHGDLHPRNIVFAHKKTVRVIDFGWARPLCPDDPGKPGELQHIVKDFVLLEANLRFMTLPPFLPYDQVKEFAEWIEMDEEPRPVKDPECNLRIDLIKDLRGVAKKHVGNSSNWDIEYIVPLFLVSLGLLKHCHSADCTWAARYTVLRLARYLVDKEVVNM